MEVGIGADLVRWTTERLHEFSLRLSEGHTGHLLYICTWIIVLPTLMRQRVSIGIWIWLDRGEKKKKNVDHTHDGVAINIFN